MSLRDAHLRVSDILSLALNPSVMTGVFFCLLAANYEPPGYLRLGHALLSVVFVTLVPVGSVFVLKARGKLSDADMYIRTERDRVYFFCVAGYAIGTVLLVLSKASWTLWGFLALHVPNTLILIAVNRRLKMSIHTMVLTSLFVGSLMFLGMQTAPVGILVLVAAWSRWDSGNHTVAELICGVLVGGLLTPVEILVLRAALGG